MSPSRLLRRELVEHLRREGLLHDPRVADAFLEIPREAFVPELLAREGLTAVYRDDAIVTRRDPETRTALSSSSQPAIMAIMLEMLDLQPGHRVLEIGAGTGYNAAILDRLAGPEGRVVSLDIDLAIVLGAQAGLRATEARVPLLVADGVDGLPGARTAGRPFDRMMVTASTTAVPRSWYDQLADDSRLVVPLRLSRELERAHAVTAFRKVPGGFDSVVVTPGGFMPLRRPDGAIFEPADAERGPIVWPVTTGEGGGGSPLAEINRGEMDRLTITVRYGRQRPAARWRIDQGDHWIGADIAPL